ncbi:MAG: FtsX-like permease family protein, partial [Spirochaetes bacterium]|nr:FtsX-like permease family protein [Spirochaetota bacterium]
MPKRLVVKIFRDIQHAPGRFFLMFAALAVSLTSLGMVMTAYIVSSRETRANYLGTRPAAATLKMDRVTPECLSVARGTPGVAGAEARASHLTRVQVGPDEWRPILLFMVREWNAMEIARFRPERGAWPPPAGTLLLERSSGPVVPVAIGGSLRVRAPGGGERRLGVSGLVHDPGLAPAWQERMAYGYVAPETLALLGIPPEETELKIAAADGEIDLPGTVALAKRVASRLAERGYRVEEIQAPPPKRHPHEAPSRTIMLMLFVSSLLILVLAGILAASLVAEWMVRERRSLGILKSVGARSTQLLIPYALPIAVLGAAAALASIPPSRALGLLFATKVSTLLNIALVDASIPAWVLALQIACGVLIPLLLTLPVLRKAAGASARSVLQAAASYSPKAAPAFGARRLLTYAVRNIGRKPGRLALTIGLLAASGALFITATELAEAWRANLERGMAARSYDVEIRFNRPVAIDGARSVLAALPGVARVEAWEQIPCALGAGEDLSVVHTYPDGGHGSFALRGAPPATAFVSFPLLAGRGLTPGDEDSLVLNHMALPLFPGVGVGGRITLRVHDTPMSFTLVGIVRELGSPAAAYVPADALRQRLGHPGKTSALRLSWNKGPDLDRRAAMRELERTLAASTWPVGLLITDSELRTAMGEHIGVLVTLLKILAFVMAVVGLLGLSAALGASVAERTREFAILKTLGATPREIRRMVVSEALLLSTAAAALALILAVPLSAMTGQWVGSLSFRTPLPLVSPLPGGLAWFL